MSVFNNLKNFIIGGLIILVMILWIQTCNQPVITNSTKTDSDTVIITRVDTTTIIKPIIKWKTTYYTIPGLQEDGTLVNYNNYADTLKNDTVTVYFSAVAHRLKESKLGFKANIPSMIIRKDSIITIENNTETITTIEKKVMGTSLSAGFSTQFNLSKVLDIAPTLYLQTPKVGIGYGYNLINKTHIATLTFPIPLFSPKK